MGYYAGKKEKKVFVSGLVFISLFVDFIGVILPNKITQASGIKYIIHHRHIVLCVYHPKSSLKMGFLKTNHSLPFLATNKMIATFILEKRNTKI